MRMPIDPDEARRSAAEILARDEFRPPRTNVAERALEAIARWLGRVFGSVGGGDGGGSVFGWLVVLAAVVLIVYLIVRSWRGRAAPAPADDAPVVTRVERGRGAADWRAEGAAHAAAGRWREAIRCRYRAAVADLTEREAIRPVPGQTTGGDRRDVADHVPALAAPFAQASDTFDRAIYGALPVGPDDLAPLDVLDRELERS